MECLGSNHGGQYSKQVHYILYYFSVPKFWGLASKMWTGGGDQWDEEDESQKDPWGCSLPPTLKTAGPLLHSPSNQRQGSQGLSMKFVIFTSQIGSLGEWPARLLDSIQVNLCALKGKLRDWGEKDLLSGASHILWGKTIYLQYLCLCLWVRLICRGGRGPGILPCRVPLLFTIVPVSPQPPFSSMLKWEQC